MAGGGADDSRANYRPYRGTQGAIGAPPETGGAAGVGGDAVPTGGTATGGGRAAVGGMTRAGMTRIGTTAGGVPTECSLCRRAQPNARG
eukprot:4030753-Alexandrium_andersonii.AAC.1